jgi:hypothetical protein
VLQELDCNQVGLDGQLTVPGQQAKMDIEGDILFQLVEDNDTSTEEKLDMLGPAIVIGVLGWDLVPPV